MTESAISARIVNVANQTTSSVAFVATFAGTVKIRMLETSSTSEPTTRYGFRRPHRVRVRSER